MNILTIQYASVGLGIWLLTWGVNRVYLMFKGFMS